MNEFTSTTSGSDHGTKLEAGVDRLAKGAHSGVDSASSAAGPAIERMAAGAHRVIDSADNVATNAAEKIEEATIKGEELVAAGTAYMRQHPVFSLSMAAVAGFVLSRMLK